MKACVIGFAVVLVGCSHDRPLTRAEGAGARHAIEASHVAAPGMVEPWSGEVRLAALEAGRIEEVLVTEGERVSAGQLVARLAGSRQRHAVAIARAERDRAHAQLATLDATPDEIRAARADLDAARALAEQRARDAARAREARLALAAADVERTATDEVVGRASAGGAEARWRIARRGARPAERRAAQARLAVAEARLAAAADALARREVRATINGLVLWSRAHAGELHVPEAGPLMILGETRRLQVRLEVDERDARAVSLGAECTPRRGAPGPAQAGAIEGGARLMHVFWALSTILTEASCMPGCTPAGRAGPRGCRLATGL